MNAPANRLSVQIYYEDTDHSGVVYHANYLKFMERAREHLLGVRELSRLWEEQQVGFVVYKCAMTFRAGARFGDRVEVRSRVQVESEYRLTFEQNVWRVERGGEPCSDELLVEGQVELVCLNGEQTLTRLPRHVLDRVAS